MLRVLKRIIAGIFADWNGVQNLLAPTLLIFLFDEYSFINWVTGIFSYHRYYIPVMLYLLFLSALIFFGLKALFAWEAETQKQGNSTSGKKFLSAYFVPYIMHIHKLLLLYLTVFMLIYVVKSIMHLILPGVFPYIPVVMFVLRYGFVVALMYNYALIDLSIPLVYKGHSFSRTLSYLKKLIGVKWKNFAIYGVVQSIWIYVSILLFKLVINLLDDILIILGLSNSTKGLVIHFFAVSNLYHFILNVLMLLTAFLVLNMLYYPMIILLKAGFSRVKFNLQDLL